MNKNENLKTISSSSTVLIIVAIIMLILSLFIAHIGMKTPVNIEKGDTVTVSDTVYKDTVLTFYKEKLVPKNVYITKTDTFYTKDGNDTIFKTEQKHYIDTLCNQNDSIILQSFITGQNVTKDSIKANWKKQETIVTNTVTITEYVEKKKTFIDHFKVGPSVTAGYDPINHQWGMVIGIGGTLIF